MQRKLKKIKRLYKLYTTGLDHREIEKLLQKDAVEAYSYYRARSVRPSAPPPKPGARSFLFAVKEIFLSFLMQLTPARRLFYSAALLLFIVGLIKPDKLYLAASFIGLSFLLALELADKLTTRDELEIAREIQMSLQPRRLPETRKLSLAAYYQPARVVGGDFYDIALPSSEKMAAIVGDVSGKGVSAALYAAYAQSMFQSFSIDDPSPTELLSKLNTLISDRLRDGDFITALAAVFDLTEKSVTIARAGHNWPLHYRAADHTVVELRPRGMSIGLFTGPEFDDALEEQKIYLETGDCLIFYSDGVTEAADRNRRMFEISGLKKAAAECAERSSGEIVDRISRSLAEFAGSDELQDDATILAVKVG
jgi:serine phosphatase RsbU (regulator of sigma subunit)